MKMKKMAASLVLLAAILFGCKKESTPAPAQPQTSLAITVKSPGGVPVKDAVVVLYPGYSDWAAKTNALGNKTTGTDGMAVFSGLSAQKYYFFASSGCFNNGFHDVSTSGDIPLNATTGATAVIDASGSLVFKNTSANPYRVYVNGAQVIDLAGGASHTLGYRPIGGYTIRVLQLSGYIVAPTDLTYTGQLQCGGVLETTFP